MSHCVSGMAPSLEWPTVYSLYCAKTMVQQLVEHTDLFKLVYFFLKSNGKVSSFHIDNILKTP